MPGQFTGISGVTENKLTIDAAGNITTLPGAPPGAQFYLHWIADTPGVVAANNFLSVFNPVGSGKTVLFYLATAYSYAVAAASAPNSMSIFRITAASAGSLVTPTASNKFLTTNTNPVAQIRTGNPTVTTVGTVTQSFPPPISTGAGAGAGALATPPPGAGAVALPGEGVVFTTAAGDTDQVWSLGVVWAEV